jgi:hypothetical protein
MLDLQYQISFKAFKQFYHIILLKAPRMFIDNNEPFSPILHYEITIQKLNLYIYF